MKDKTIAVLPFVNMSSSTETEYFSDGMTEEIINALAKIDSLKVTSRTSAFYFKGKNIPITEIGKQLNVSTILEGSVRMSGRAIRITAQLIQAEEDFHFWSETWDRQLDDIFEIQDEISLLIAEKLREHLGHFEIQDHLVVRQTEELDAYTLFLKGRYHSNKWNPEDMRTAMSFYEKALEVDPKHSNSLAGLADSYSFLATCGFISYEEGWSKCAELTHQALAITDQLPAAHYQLANLAFFTACDYAKSFDYVKKALIINPNHIESLQFMSFLYILAGKQEKAREYLQLALSVDPLSQETLFYSAYLDYMTGNFSNSLKQLDACLEVNPKNIPVHSVKALCLLMLRRFDEVVHYFDRLPAEIVIPAEQVGTQVLAYAMWKEEENTAKYLKLLQELANGEDGFTADSYLFFYYGATWQNDKAFAWIKRAQENHSPLLLLRYADPIVQPIKEDPRYKEFHAQLFPPDIFKERRKKKKKALLDKKEVEHYRRHLLDYMTDEMPYLDANLSLRSLAKMIKLQPNQLSWLLNSSIGKNFSEFVNAYRVETFKRLAKDPANKNITIMGLAFDSGFNSKTVFNTYFKKETGLTPRQFLKA